jgi:hypothetical protein
VHGLLDPHSLVEALRDGQDALQATLDHFLRRWWPGQLPAQPLMAELYPDDTFTLEGHELRIIEQGRTDTAHTTSLDVPSIDLVVGGDVLYNQCQMFVGDTTPASRRNWITALDRLAALRPKIDVAGHEKTGAPEVPSAIGDSKRYLEGFGRLQRDLDRPAYDRPETDGGTPEQAQAAAAKYLAYQWPIPHRRRHRRLT